MVGRSIYNLINDLFPISRSITGDGVRETLRIIKETHLPSLNICEIPTGEEIEDWKVPKEWNIKDAYIKNSKGNKILSFKENNLHILGYSKPINIKLKLEELKEHLYSLPEQPDAIPYVTSYYKETWGFCLTHNQYESLKDDEYVVSIDSKLEDGSLTYADLIIKGQEKKEIFISTYICHPSMANNELSGPGVATYLAKWLSERPNNRYTYRFCFVPETLGSIAYISNHGKGLGNTYAAFNLTCVGDEKNYSFLPSRKGNTITDKVARHCIKNQQVNYKEYNFLKDRGSDERQYCSPKVDLPMVSIMKSKYGEYPEYHTSLDNMDFISAVGLEDSYRVHKECIEILENNYFYKSKIKGEPFLSKRGKNYMIVGGIENDESRSAQLILDIMSCCDGDMDIVDISEALDIYALDLIPIIQSLEIDQLIEKS
tara:strand:+ start:9336 stop:10622 length:1287 start_codon:yes stop_codon:yes gene_type:complete